MITVAILNYNGNGIIEKSVESVLTQSRKPDEILVIDNSSTDGSWKLVKNHVSRIYHADNKHQFITGLNSAFEQAKHELVVFMENDILLHKNCVLDMLEYPADIVSPLFLDSKFHKYKIEWYTGFLSACFMMNKIVYDKVGPFDINLAPAYWEDVDYSIRAHRLGLKTKKGVGIATHLANWSFSKVFTKKQMSGWCRRNAWYILRKHYLNRAFRFLCNEKNG
jgi:GT2 family glycosyltransferase